MTGLDLTVYDGEILRRISGAAFGMQHASRNYLWWRDGGRIGTEAEDSRMGRRSCVSDGDQSQGL